MSDLYPETELKPDVIYMHLDKNTPIGPLFSYLAQLDRYTTGYQDEITDEYGDNPEVVDIDPSIKGYLFGYGSNGLVTPHLTIVLDRDKPLREQWTRQIHHIAHYGLKIRFMLPYRQCNPLREWHPVWDEYIRGLYPQCMDFIDGIRPLYGADLDHFKDYKIVYSWLDYVFKSHDLGTAPDNVDYYAFTGSLGHGD